MNTTKKFIKTSIIYLIGNVLSKLIAFILIPIYTTYISPNIYGEFDLINSLISLVVPLIFFQVWDGLFRFVYDYEDIKEKYFVVSNSFNIFIFGIILYEIIFIITSKFINIPGTIFVNIYGISYAAQYLFGTVARTFKQNKLYMISGVVNTLVNLLLNIILIVVLKQVNINSLFLSIILGNFVQCLIIFIKLDIIKYTKLKNINFHLIKKMIKFSMPIAVSTISYWLLTGYTKVFISKNFGYSSNGIFAMGSKMASFILVIVSVMQMAWHESSFEVANNKDKKEFYQKGLNSFLIILLYSTISIILLLKVIFPIIIKGEYYESIKIMPIILIYTSINAFSGFASSQFLAEKDSKIPLYTTLISAFINILLLFLLKKFDIFGASIALFISFFINTALRIILLKKKYNIKINKKNILSSIIILIIVTFIYYKLNNIINIICFIILLIYLIFKYKDIFLRLINKNSNYMK